MYQYSVKASSNEGIVKTSLLQKDDLEAAAIGTQRYARKMGCEPTQVVVRKRTGNRWETVLTIGGDE